MSQRNLHCNVEINKDQPDKTNKAYLFRTCYRNGVSLHCLCLAETQREEENLYSGIKKDVFRCALIRNCGPGEARVRLTTSGASHGIGYRCKFKFLWLILNWKQGQKLGKSSVIHQVLAIFGQLQQRVLLGFLGWLLQLWARALLSHRQWLGHCPLACSVSQHSAFNQQFCSWKCVLCGWTTYKCRHGSTVLIERRKD